MIVEVGRAMGMVRVSMIGDRQRKGDGSGAVFR